MGLLWFRRLCLFGALLAFCVIVLGAWTRLGHAGLGCPDWPGCYGHLTVGQAVEHADEANAAFPDRPLEADKASKEMVHRYFASTLGLVIVAIAMLAFARRRNADQPLRLPALLVLLVVFQGLLGMWTVTLLLKPLIVTAHLVGGLTTMSLLWWLGLGAERAGTPHSERGLRRLAVLGLDAFVLWRGLGIDYEGGVLNHPARVAIHFTHRLGAVVTALVLGLLAWKTLRTGGSRALRTAGSALAIVLVTQWIVGPVMVLETFPLPLATAHNAVAALLLICVVTLVRLLSPAPAVVDPGRR
jgi:cytochrome c oxidase assembly protein subunit 15